MVTEKETKDIIREDESKRKSWSKTITDKFTTKQVALFVGAQLLLAFLYFSTKSISKNTYIISIIAIVLIALSIFSKKDPTSNIITIKVARANLYDYLLDLQKEGVISRGNIMIEKHFKLQYTNSEPKKYWIGATILDNNFFETYYAGCVDCHNGYIIGYRQQVAPYRGDEVKDHTYINSVEDRIFMQRRQTYGKMTP
jgi:hypothetical protein